MRELQLQAGKTTCTQTAQCRTVATGHKACGGAEAYLAWSAADGDAERIGELAARQRDLRRIEVTKSDRQSTCSVVQDPGAQCVEGRCVLRRADRAD
jgi:hypothetical protein